MDALRTPEDRFAGLPGWTFEPDYIDDLPGYEGLRLACHDTGPHDAPVFLCLHGEPSWSYLYRKMAPVFLETGFRVVMPDLLGFGRSDKPVEDSVYTFHWHRNYLKALIERLDLRDVTLVCQDWGGMLGLTLPMDYPDRFKRLIVMNTGIGVGKDAGPGFNAWRDYMAKTPDLNVGALMQRATPGLSDAEAAAYAAPFPDDRYKAGVRRFPAIVPTSPDMEGVETGKAAAAFWREAATHVLLAFGSLLAATLTGVPIGIALTRATGLRAPVLNALNIRLDPAAIAFILEHGEARVLLTDTEFSPTIHKALHMLDPARRPLVIDIDDPMAATRGPALGALDYEALLAEGDPAYQWAPPADEWRAISLNYTSGTTGNPKGVVYHHRGAYLLALGNVLTWEMPQHPVYLWTLPMFHCNGWCFPWTVAAVAGTNVCMRQVTGKGIFDAIADQGVTHFCGAPIVLNMVINTPPAERRAFDHTVRVMTAAAPPPASTLEGMEREGFRVTHVYGLTEVYGPAVVCAWQDEWNALPPGEQAALKSRQGVRYPVLEDLTVMDPETMTTVPADGETIGEVMFRGNVVMKGYVKNPKATEEALGGGWFHSGDLGVLHPDGYIQLKDRSKDIIISGGENISSIEVEDVLYKHPAIAACGVVAKADDKWGETPCAFVELKEGASATAEEIVAFCRERLAHYKCPRHVVFAEIPKTSTGKIQKFRLREMAQAL